MYLDQELHEYAQQWREKQSPLPDGLLRDLRVKRHHPTRLLVAAVLAAGIIIAGVAVLRSGTEKTPSVQSPASLPEQTVDVPKIDVVPLYLPINASELYAGGKVFSEISVRQSSSGLPTPAEQQALRACNLGLVGSSPIPTHYAFYEDPGYYSGTPSTPAFAAPPAPLEAPTCTQAAANAALTIREVDNFFSFRLAMENLEQDPTITAARRQEIACMQDRGVTITADGFISDGWVMTHTADQQAQAQRDYADCIQPVVAARDQVRSQVRAQYLSTYSGAITRLQEAFDSYLHAIYNPNAGEPVPGSLDTLPADTFNDGCISISDLDNAPSTLSEEQIRAATGITTHGVMGMEGRVTVCDKPNIQSRHAYIAYVPPAPPEATGSLYVLDPTTAALLDRRPLKS